MIRTRAGLFSRRFSVALLLLLTGTQALAQGLPKVPPDIKSSNEVSGSRGAIEQFMTSAVAQLTTGTPDQQKEARDALGREITINGQPTASAAYTTLYAQLLNAQLQTLAKHQDTRVRLNAAIICYSVARVAGGATLVPAAKDFINDAEPAVALWGVKSARPLVPAELRAFPGNASLPKAIVAAAQKHKKGTIGGAIIVDAYDALALDINDPAKKNSVTPAMIQAVIPYVHELMAFRVGEFRKGIPPEPGAERAGAGFLVHPMVWPVQNAQQKQKTMQVLSDLVALAAVQANAPKVSQIDQGYLVRIVIPNLAASISVAAAGTDPAIVAAVTPVATPVRGGAAAQMATLVNAIYPAIKASKTYGAVTAPPAVTGNEAAPAPASAPTTGPVAIPGASAIPIAAPGAATRPAGAPPPPGARPASPTPPPAGGPGNRPPPPPPPGGRPPTPPSGASGGK